MSEMQNKIQEAVKRLKQGEIVVFPTETFFALGVDPYNQHAVERLLNLKSRSDNQGVSLIAADIKVVNSLKIKDLNREKREKLQNKFWPGPLTLVLAFEQIEVSRNLLAKDGSLALRVSSGDIARNLAQAIGGLITATSANPHAKLPAKTLLEAKQYFPDLFVVDGGSHETQPSTIVNLQKTPYEVLREGVISTKELSPYL
jgi:L-threonylcarbamoyladenylate synthase